MNTSKKILAVGVVGAIAFGAMGQANASAYAGSSLSIDNLNILITEDGTSPSPNVTIRTFEFTATNTARLNGVDALQPGQSLDCGGTPGPGNNDCGFSPVLDPIAANANGPGSGSTIDRANTDYSRFGPSGDTYANSNSVIDAAELVNFVPTATRQIAEAELQGSGSGRAGAEITSNTGFTFEFEVSGATNNELVLDFLATPYLRAYIDTDGFESGSAQANMNVSFTLSRAQADGGGSVQWAPGGLCFDVGSGTDCTVDNNAFSLNQNPSVSSSPDDDLFDPGQGRFGITVADLSNGVWTLALNANTSVSVRQTVPEPSVIALLGLGLAGLGFAARRRLMA